MGDLSHEPSMEDILASIKKIIADDNGKPAPGPRVRRAAIADPRPAALTTNEPEADAVADVLELTSDAETPAEDGAPTDGAPAPRAVSALPDHSPITETPVQTDATSLVAEPTVAASRAALAQLTAQKPRSREPEAPSDRVLEALVIEAMRPMLKDWLDANLPRVVEKMVAREIARLRSE